MGLTAISENDCERLGLDGQQLVNLALGQNRILEMIAAGLALDTTLNALLSFLERDVPDMVCSILLLDAEGARLKHCAAPSLPGDYTKLIDGAPIGPSAGSCGTAAYRREQVIVTDIEQDPLWADYRHVAARFGLRACWSTPIFDARGSVLGTFAMYFQKPCSPAPLHRRLIDIALHVAAVAIGKEMRDKRVYESEERYRLINMATNDAVWDWDVRTGTLWWNDAICSLFGYSRSEISSDISWWVDRVHRDDRERVNESLHLAASTGGASAWNEEYRFRRKDGEFSVVQDRGYAMRDPNGNTIRMVGLMQDISQRKEAEARIRRLSRTHEMMSTVNSTMVRVRERQQLLRQACRIAVELGQFSFAWVAGADVASDGLKLLVSSSERAGETAQSVLGACPEANDIFDHVRKTLLEGRVNHWSKLESRVTLPPLSGAPVGPRALIALPLRVGGEVLGALVFHTLDRDLFDAEEVKLLSELADNISFALESIEHEQHVKELAYTEPITRLPNRAALQARIELAIEDATACQGAFSLVILNLNYFRDVNDSLGHLNGDALLACVAQRLRERLDGRGHVACLGGDEFAVLLPNVSSEPALEALLYEVHETLRCPIALMDIPIKLGATLGVAIYPEHGPSAEALWRHASIALRTAKERHEEQLIYSSEIDQYQPARLALVGELQTAIGADQLVLHYQPKVDVRTGRTIALEALVRWQHPTRGLVYPDAFIPLAERTGLVNPLTIAVLNLGLRQGKQFRASGFPLELSVNLSARSLHDRKFCRELLQVVKDSGFPLSCLTLEITETAIMQDPVRAKAALLELREAEIHLSMDDFGIGQSSLTYLKELPITKMKIDKSFVMDFERPSNVAIVRSAIDLARNMGLQVTAEGVEAESTFLALRELGCDVAQGYYFSKPLPVDKLSAWLWQSQWGCAAGPPGH